MAQYISKSSLVAEIKIRQSEHDEKKYGYASSDHFWASVEDGKILSLIDKLEVKEVDLEHLEQEVKDFCYKFDDRKDKWYDMTPHDKNIMISPTWSNFAMQLAKHFFVLGLKAQKGEEV